MRNIFEAFLITVLVCLVFFCGIYVGQSKVNLPEEYKLITTETPIKGSYNKETEVLDLEFDHNIQFKWNNSLLELPDDGQLIKIEYTDENTVYLNLID